MTLALWLSRRTGRRFPLSSCAVALATVLCISYVAHAQTNHAPTLSAPGIPATFAAGANVTRTLTVKYHDDDGANDIDGAHLTVNRVLTDRLGIAVRYDARANLLWLRNDEGTAWIGGFAPRSANIISNAQGQLKCASTTVTRTATDLSVSFVVTALAPLDGANTVYAWVNDLNGASSGSSYTALGPWNVTGAAPSVVLPSPLLALSTPVTQEQSLPITYRDPNGASSIREAWVMVNRVNDWTGSICASYDSLSNLLWLRSDDATSWIGGFAPGSQNVISNAQGSIDCNSTTVTRTGTDMVVNWKITPLDGAVGSNSVYAYTADRGERSSGIPFVSIGTWKINNAGHAPTLSAASVAFAGGPGVTRQIPVTFHDDDGAGDLNTAWLLINREQTSRLGLSAMYDVRANKLWLRDDNDAAWIGGFAPQSQNVISNALGSLNCAGTTVTRSGNDLTVSYSMTAGTALDGHNGVWAYCNDRGGLSSGQPFTGIGFWDVTGQAPLVVAPSPPLALNTVNGQERGVVVTLRDPDGAASQINAQVVINDRLAGGDAVYVYYLALNNQLFLRSDNDSGWLGGFAPGSANTISNAQGSLDCSRTTVTRSGTDLILDLKITPRTGLVGINTIYAYAQDRAGNTSPYTAIGTWKNSGAAPQTLTAVAGNTQATLNWGAVSGATGYTLARSLSKGKGYAALPVTIAAGTTSFIDTGLTNGTTYYYVVFPQLASGRGPDSVEAAVTPLPPPVAAPVVTIVAGNGKVTLSWKAIAGATSYKVLRANADGTYPVSGIAPVSTSALSSAISGLSNGTSYSFVVKASNSAGDGPASTPVAAVPVAPIPGAPTLTGVAGIGQATLSWTAVSGAANYTLKSSTSPGGPYSVVASNLTGTSYTQSGLTNGATLYFVLSASNADGVAGALSNEVTLSPNFFIDARINRGTGTTWIGQNIVNSTAQNQEVSQGTEAGTTATYFVAVRRASSSTSSSETVRMTVPGFAAFETAGGLAHFFVGTGTQEITDIITGATGWTTTIAPGAEAVVRLEIVVPAGTAADTAQSLLVKVVDEDGSATPLTDAVRASLGVVASSQMDVVLERLSSDGASAQEVGGGVLNDDPKQTISSVVAPGEAQTYLARVKNTGQSAAFFHVQMKGSDNATPWAAQGWTAAATVNGTTTNVTALLQSAGGWTTPPVPVGEEVVVKISLTATTPAPSVVANPSFKIAAWSGVFTDTVVALSTVQSLANLQWSRDGQAWQNVTATTRIVIEQDETVGLRAIKAVAGAAWPDAQPLGPDWKWGDATLTGETVWVAGSDVTGALDKTATATLGTQKADALIRVVPASNVLLSVSESNLLAGVGTTAMTSTEVTVRVSKEDATPQGATKVRLRAINEAGATVGKWNGAAASQQDVTTDAAGVAHATWTSGVNAGQVRFEAVVLDENDLPRDVKDGLDIETHKPYTRVDVGQWVEANGSWSRTIKVSTWFLGQKVGGRAVALASQIKDYETQQAVAGWTSAAPFDAASGTTDASGNFSTVQRWNPVEAGAWPHDYLVDATATLN